MAGIVKDTDESNPVLRQLLVLIKNRQDSGYYDATFETDWCNMDDSVRRQHQRAVDSINANVKAITANYNIDRGDSDDDYCNIRITMFW